MSQVPMSSSISQRTRTHRAFGVPDKFQQKLVCWPRGEAARVCSPRWVGVSRSPDSQAFSIRQD